MEDFKTLKTLSKISIEIDKNKLYEIFDMVYDKSGLEQLEQAISMAQNFISNKQERKDIDFIRSLYIFQCDGKLIPPISLNLMYEDHTKNKEEEL